MEEIKIGIVPNKEELKKRLTAIREESEQETAQAEEVAPAGSIDDQLKLLLIISQLLVLLALFDQIKKLRNLARNAKQKIIDEMQRLANEVSKNRGVKAEPNRSQGSFGASVDVGGG
jgi:hypothetical protein